MQALIIRSVNPVEFTPAEPIETLSLAVFDSLENTALDFGQPEGEGAEWGLVIPVSALPDTLYKHLLRFEWTIDEGLDSERLKTELYLVVRDESEIPDVGSPDILTDLVTPPTLVVMRDLTLFLADYGINEVRSVGRVNRLVNDGLYRASLQSVEVDTAQSPLVDDADRPDVPALVCQTAVVYATMQLKLADDEFQNVDRWKTQFDEMMEELGEVAPGVY